MRKSTAGGDICCKWKEGNTSQEKLSNFKESHKIQVANYAVDQGIDYEPQGIDNELTLNWQACHVLKKRNTIFLTVVELCSVP